VPPHWPHDAPVVALADLSETLGRRHALGLCLSQLLEEADHGGGAEDVEFLPGPLRDHHDPVPVCASGRRLQPPGSAARQRYDSPSATSRCRSSDARGGRNAGHRNGSENGSPHVTARRMLWVRKRPGLDRVRGVLAKPDSGPQTERTFSACGPFGPWVTSNSTF
jgi:hypothetical protein